MNNIFVTLHNIAHNVAFAVDTWAQAHPKATLLIATFSIGVIIGALFF